MTNKGISLIPVVLMFWPIGSLLMAQSCDSPNAGYRVLNISSLNVAVWYPSPAAATTYSYNDSISGNVALNGPVTACVRHPLLVFSHGYRGCGTQSVFLTEQLARAGYIIAAPDHADAGCSVSATTGGNPPISISVGQFLNPETWTDQSSIDRKSDIERTIDGMLASPSFGSLVDRSRIGGFGHSLGGYTIFGMMGGWSTWKEPRIGAALLLSPYVQPFMAQSPSLVPNASGPIMYLGGTVDTIITPAIMRTGGAYDQTSSVKFFADVQGANHLDFSNSVCGNGPTSVEQCLATVPMAKLITAYSEDFFDTYLTGNPPKLLFGSGAGLAAYRFTSPPPAINPNGVGPIFSKATTIQPGEWVSIYGNNLSAPIATWTGEFPTALGGTRVTINGKLAYLWYVSPNQINLQAPDDSIRGPVSVVVTTPSGTASTVVTLAQSGPSFCLLDDKHVAGIVLRKDGSGKYGGGDYDILGPTGNRLGYVTAAAQPGDTVVLFAVGLGPTDPAVPAGQAFSGAAPISSPVELLLNGTPVAPDFVGLSSSGLFQINLTLPAGVGSGDLPLAIVTAESQTPTNVVLSVK